MTDKDKTISFLNDLKIPFSLEESGNRIKIKEGNSEIVKGYACFFTAFEFDNDGKLVEMGAWEE